MRPAKSEVWTPMEYKNTEIKLNVLVNYFNEGRINLAPVFHDRSAPTQGRHGYGQVFIVIQQVNHRR